MIVRIARWVIIICVGIIMIFIHWIAFLLYVGLVVYFKTKKNKINDQVSVTKENSVVFNDDEYDYDEEYRVVGVSYENEDGENRQEVLKRSKKGDPITLKIGKYKNERTVEVWCKQGMIGFISRDELEEVLEELDGVGFASVSLGDIYGGTKNKPTIGCSVEAKYH